MRCFLYGQDLDNIPTDKDGYVSSLIELTEGVLWCEPHFEELSLSIGLKDD